MLTTLPPGFAEERLVQGLSDVTAMAIAPDGRLFVAEQGGRLRVVRDGQVLTEPFVTVQTDFFAERGLIGVALDPDFASNGHVYVFYTTAWGLTPYPPHGRVSRFTALGDVADPGSEVVLAVTDWAAAGGIHNGGALRFGPDGKLYVGVGDNGSAPDAQVLSAFAGKILRINPDGSIPTDNPFYNDTFGPYRAIYARGFRNPFTFDIHPATGRLLANDVGQVDWEEINDVSAGANYGWPATEGDFDPQQFPDYTRPIHTYSHDGHDAAVTGGVFYAPDQPTYPSEYLGDYFFADFVNGWINRLDFATPDGAGPFTVRPFAAGVAPYLVDLDVGPDGNLYYLSRGDGAVWRIRLALNEPPVISVPPEDQTVPFGLPVTFSVVASGAGPFTYQWQRDGVDLPGAVGSSYTLAAVMQSDHGAEFRCRVSNVHGQTTSAAARLSVIDNQPPTANILGPVDGTLYTAGDTIQFVGYAVDPETGTITPGNYTWRIDLHHDTHVHPFIPEMNGVFYGEFIIPTTGHVEANVWYRINFSATDPHGISSSAFVDVMPRTAEVTIAAEAVAPVAPAPALNVMVDGSERPAPYSFVGVAGGLRLMEAPPQQDSGGQTYQFVSWSDGATEASRMLSTPIEDTTLTARYRDVTPPQVLSSGFAFERSAPGGPPHRVTFTFSEDVWASVAGVSGAFRIRRASDGWEVPASALAISWDAATRTVIVGVSDGSPAGVLPDGAYEARTVASITDSTGNPLAAPAVVEFFVLSGDANRDRTVGIADFSILATNFNTPGVFADGDFNYNGMVEIGDFSILASRFNTSLPSARAGVRFVGPLRPVEFSIQRIDTDRIFGEIRLLS